MSNRVGPHYSSYHATHGVVCKPFCENEATHWECSERNGDKHFSCSARCDAHKSEPSEDVTIRPL
jgi:hypothetical protein